MLSLQKEGATMRRGLFVAGGMCVAASGAALLTGCSGGGVGSLPSVANLTFDQMLYKVDTYAVLEGSTYTVRSDVQGKSWLTRPSYDVVIRSPGAVTMSGGRRIMAAQDCTVGMLVGGTKVIGCVTSSSSSPSGMNGLTTIFGTSPGGANARGPIWQLPSINYLKCLASTLGAGLAGLGSIALQITANPGKYGEAYGWAKEFRAGAISAAEFAGVLLATIPAAELAALATVAGVSLVSIALAATC
jgi:hypothetical protein